MPKINQRAIIEVNYLFPDGKFKPHPAIVVSNADLLGAEDFFYVVMMTTKNYHPEYTFQITAEMLNNPSNKLGFVASI